MPSHMKDLKYATDEYMRKYVPNVYQENIYGIDYKRLKEKGIELVTFDVDDTIIPDCSPHLPDEAIILFTELRRDFRVMLVSNSKDEKKVQRIAESLHVEKYVAKAKKPDPKYLIEIIEFSKLKEDQIAHVGNSIKNDIGLGNSLRITTCLVRPVAHAGRIVPELEKRGLWHKHHRVEKGDQYYQLGEKQRN